MQKLPIKLGGSSSSVEQAIPNGFDCFTYALRNYAVFSGRACRREYWLFVLFSLLINAGISLIGSLVYGATGFGLFILVLNVFNLGLLIPSLALLVRRLHDVGRSGWWSLIALVPAIGFLLLLFWAVSDGEPHSNQYGLPRQ